MAFDLSIHVHRLLRDEPFFAALSRHINKSESRAIPTAGVRLNAASGRYELIYNPDFIDTLHEEEVLLILKHEYLHLIFDHVGERLPEDGMTRDWNVATDAAINGEIFPKEPNDNIRKLFDMGVLPEKLDLPRGFAAEYYFKEIRKKKEEQKANGKGDKSQGSSGESGDGMPEGFDDHEGWGAEDGENPVPNDIRELAKERIKEAMRDGAQEAMKKGWGTVSSTMQKEITDRITSKVDWRKVLRYFVKASQRADKQSSIKKINRRFPYIHSGRKTNRTAKIAISIDQSGSVSDHMLALFYAELDKLSTYAEFTVVPFDTQVAEDKVYVWKKGEKRKAERVLHGGTCFNAPTRWVNEHAFDGHIVLTDMCAPKPVPSKCQRMWMTDAANAKNPYFTTNERTIAIE